MHSAHRLDNAHAWNDSTENRPNFDDAPQLEYDEHDINLIADRGKSPDDHVVEPMEFLPL